METNATRMCALLVGLPAITVIGVDNDNGAPLRVHVETVAEVAGCAGCGTRAWLKDQRPVELVDLPAFGRPAVLVWHKRRWRCWSPAEWCKSASVISSTLLVSLAQAVMARGVSSLRGSGSVAV